MAKEKFVTKQQEKQYLEQLKKDFAITDKKGEVNSVNELIGKKLNRRAYTIYWINMVIFIILCAGVFMFLISPIVLWILGHGPGSTTFTDKFKKVTIFGICFVVVAA